MHYLMKLIFSSNSNSSNNNIIMNLSDSPKQISLIHFNSNNKVSNKLFLQLSQGKKGCSSCGNKN